MQKITIFKRLTFSHVKPYHQFPACGMKILIAALFFFICTSGQYAQAQEKPPVKPPIRTSDSVFKTPSKKVSYDASKINWKRMLNGAYSTLLGSGNNAGLIGSYASLEPVNGILTFKGSIPIGNVKTDHLSFLNITAQGELTEGNFATVFKDTKLNTNAGITLEWNVRLKKTLAAVDGPQKKDLQQQIDYITYLQDAAISRYNFEYDKIPDKIKVLEAQNTVSAKQLALKKQQANALLPKIDSVKLTDAERDKAALDYQTLRADIPKIEKAIVKNQVQIDSMNILSGNSEAKDYYEGQQRELTEAKQVKLEDVLTFTAYRFFWLNVIAGSGKKDYYTFDKTQPFGTQLQNPQLATYKVGLGINYYAQDNVTKQGILLNIGLLRSRDNNINLLKTEEISQEAAFKNSGGDTTRKAAKKYSAYTDVSKIVEKHQWNAYMNFYYIFNGGSAAIHLFPSWYKPNDHTGYMDSGLGLMFSFKDSKNEKSKLNLEAYLIVNDTFNNTGLAKNFADRNEFGVRVTLPFNQLFK